MDSNSITRDHGEPAAKAPASGILSKHGTQFRQWATRVVREHLVRGFTPHEKRLQEIEVFADLEDEGRQTSARKTAVH